jgi:hypothetical protein
MVLLTGVILLVTIQLIHLIRLIPDVDSPDYYYSCEGVQGGVATGDTYPIPQCFDDQTGRDQPMSVLIISSFIRKQLVVAGLLGLCCLLYYMTMGRLWQRSHCCQKRRLRRRRVTPGGAQNDGDPKNINAMITNGEGVNEKAESGVDQGDNTFREDESDDMDDDSFCSFMSERTGVPPPPDVFSLAWIGVEKVVGVEKVEGTEPLTSTDQFDDDDNSLDHIEEQNPRPTSPETSLP